MEGALAPIVVFLLVYVAITFEVINKAVCPLGAAEVVSLCQLNEAPIYLMAGRLKFSPKPGDHHRTHEKHETRPEDQTAYSMTVHAHCLVDLRHVDCVVREDGVFPREAVLKPSPR